MTLMTPMPADCVSAPGAPLTFPGVTTPAGRHLVAIDIDGTTVHHDGTLTSAVHDAVRRVAEAGHDVVVATGRSVLAARPVIDALGLRSGYAVCSNGAVTIALDPSLPGGHEVVDTMTFDPGPALSLLAREWPEAVFAVERLGLGFDAIAPFAEGELDGDVRVVGWDELVARPTTRVTFYHPGLHAEEFARDVEALGLHGVNYAVGFTAWLDVTPEGVSKASALEGVRRRLRANRSRTVAVGDQRNDLEMFEWAACGVAMGNAPAEVAARADLVTAHVHDDGLALVLDSIPSRG
ncbi:HAD family hydrolase [Agilicoccus flavus]|uniref:HAD family hydrolase n=1 Tax=Agilicoccus flavus TaxID=2775968 RepID=UPI0027DA58FD|nr:HAD family hydrolase [Agilicoccus flavus]